MATRKSTSKTARKSAKKTVRAATGSSSARQSNGMKKFAMHALDSAVAPAMATLRAETARGPAIAGTAALTQLDPETVAKSYLEQALASKAVPSFTAPRMAADVPSEFKTIGTESIPLTGTRTVKFRQNFNKIPVFGSLVTVELDDNNNLVSMNSSMGEPQGVDPVAKISPAAALKAIERYPGFRKSLDGVVPRLHYYFDITTSTWHLAFIAEDVPVDLVRKSKGPARPVPALMDYIVDAHTGKLIAEIPASPTMAAVVETAVDNQGKSRHIRVEKNGSKRILRDSVLNVHTFDFRFRDPSTEEHLLPGSEIKNPPKWSPAAVSAHANASAVAEFLQNVVRRNNIDNKGGAMKSSINCVDKSESEDGKQWFNAFWNGKQMVYGQRIDGKKVTSLASNIDVVAHEMFHGVTDFTSGLVYQFQPGALNESYSDIFGIIISNLGEPDPRDWDWELGEGLDPGGKPFRDLRDPTLFDQPAHMKNFRVLPNTWQGDWGGVHINSGIHNKAAHLILTAVDSSSNLMFTPQEVAAVFYIALTQHLSRTSQFSDSRRAALLAAQTYFRTRPPAEQKAKLEAIGKGFDGVGIKE